MNLRHYLLAREAAEKSIAINPQYARGYYALAWTLFSDTRFVSNRKGEIPLRATRADVTQSRLRLASAATAAGLAISPRDVSFLVLKSMICLHSLDPHEALIAADEGLAIDPTSADCHRNRAMVLRYIGDTTGAEKASSHALATEPESPHSHYVAGWTALTSGRYSAARDHFITLLCVDPLFPHARTGLLFALRSQFWPYRPVVWVIVRSQNFLRSRVLFRPVFSIGSGLFSSSPHTHSECST